MKTISVSLEESEIDELLRSTGTHNNSEMIRSVIKEWKNLKIGVSSQDKEIEELKVKLFRAKGKYCLDRALTVLLFVLAAVGFPTLIWIAIVRYGL